MKRSHFKWRRPLFQAEVMRFMPCVYRPEWGHNILSFNRTLIGNNISNSKDSINTKKCNDSSNHFYSAEEDPKLEKMRIY